jgi:hypothetical protein
MEVHTPRGGVEIALRGDLTLAQVRSISWGE